MDLASLIGFLLESILVFGAMATSSVGLGGFIDIPSLMITVGGSIAGTIIAFPLGQITGIVGIFKQVLTFKPEKADEIINQIVSLADKARKEGILALENEAANLSNEFLKQGLELAIDGTEADLIRDIMNTEISFIEDRHAKAASIFDTWGSLGPAFGMIGTLVGLIAMLANMDDPASIGPNMSVALITTLYGSMIANMLTTPVSGKLKFFSAQEILVKELILEGIMSIQAGDNPRLIQKKLMSFLDQKTRKLIEPK